MKKNIKIDLGCGRKRDTNFITIDRLQIIDGKGNKMVDHILDLEKDKLPFEDNSVDEIRADDFLEHIYNLDHIMNEAWRVLKKGGIFHGHVPVCGTKSHYKDPTHRRCFILQTFLYFTGKSNWKDGAPLKPKYADYGFKSWDNIEEPKIRENGELIDFKMTPRK